MLIFHFINKISCAFSKHSIPTQTQSILEGDPSPTSPTKLWKVYDLSPGYLGMSLIVVSYHFQDTG